MYFADYDLGCTEEEIDILVVTNYYWSFTSDRVTRIDNQLVSGSFQPLPPIPPASVNVVFTRVLKRSSESSVIRYDKLETFWDAEFVEVLASNPEISQSAD